MGERRECTSGRESHEGASERAAIQGSNILHRITRTEALPGRTAVPGMIRIHENRHK